MKTAITNILLTAAAIQAHAEGNAHTTFASLDIPISAHAAALGGNISLIEDDATLALRNPALLSSVSHRTLTLSYLNYSTQTRACNAQYTHVADEKTTCGANIQYIDYGKMKQTNAEGEEEGNFNAADITLQALLAYNLTDNLVGGISAKYIHSRIASYNSTAAAIDLGLNYYDPQHDLSLSVALRNLGGQLTTYNEQYESMPLDVAAGATWKPHNSPLRFSLTITDLNHWDYSLIRHANIAIDLILSQQLYLAAAYNPQREHDMKVTAHDGTQSSHGAGLSIGAGLLLDKFKLNIAYAKQHLTTAQLIMNIAFGI